MSFNGICCGGGLELALSANMIIAADHASFALPEFRSGTVADAASIKLPKRIPYHIAMDMLCTGRWLDSEETMNKITKSQFKMVETLYTSEDQLEGARAFAEKRDPIWKSK